MSILSRIKRGLGIAPPVEVLPDGRPFQRYPAQGGPDWGWILRGCRNVRSKVWNACEITGPWMAASDDDPILDRLRNYTGGLRSDPRSWPDPYRKVFLESHPNFRWDGITRPDVIAY